MDQEYARVLSTVDAPLSTAYRLKLTFGVGANEEGASEAEVDEQGAYGQENGGAEGNGERRSEHPMKAMFSEQTPMPFELAMLEAMLQEVGEFVFFSVWAAMEVWGYVADEMFVFLLRSLAGCFVDWQR